MEAPVCPKYPYVHRKHKHDRPDPYQWLNKRGNDAVLEYLQAENAYCKAYFQDQEKDIEALFEEMKARIAPDDASVPYFLNDYWYQTRYESGKEYPIFSRRLKMEDAPEEIILDVNELAKDHNYYNVGGKSISPNNRMLCFGEDTLSRRIYTLRIRNLITGEYEPESIPGTTGGAVWAADNQTLFYTRKDETTLRSHQIWKHKLGTSTEEDVMVYEETDEVYSCFVYKTKSRDYIVIGSASSTSSEYRYIKTSEPDADFTLFQPRTAKHEYSFTHFADHFYLLSNHEEQNFSLYKCPVNAPSADWELVVGGSDQVMLESVEIFEDYLVLVERKAGLTHLRVMSWDGKHDTYIPFHDPTYSVDLEINMDFESDWLRFTYTSLTTPTTIFAYHLETAEQKVLKQQKVLGGFQVDDYESQRTWAKASDGTEVPISLVYKKDGAPLKERPMLLYGYGSYGISMDPYFSSIRISLLDRGFVFAIAHIRGGEELGRAWYENAKWLKKMNTFTDFIACGEHVKAQGLCHPEQLFAMGGSAGGLLMGAVMNIAPSLWAGIVASVPFVDVVTTMLDDSIPLTTGEYEEWGNPNEKEYYEYMLSYSPYDNITAQNYPPLLVTSGYHDSQVQYWEPTKWVAKLRDVKTDNNPLLLHTNLEAGHSGVSGRFAPLKEVAMEYVFLLKLANKL